MRKPKEAFYSTFGDVMLWSYFIFSFGQTYILYEIPWLWPSIGLGIILMCILGAPIALIAAGLAAGITAFLNWIRLNDYALGKVSVDPVEVAPHVLEHSNLFEKVNKAIVLFDNDLYILNESCAGTTQLYRANGNELAYNELVSTFSSDGKLADAHQLQLIALVISLQYTPTPRTPIEPVVEIDHMLHEKIILKKNKNTDNKIDELTVFLKITYANKPDAQALSREKSALEEHCLILIHDIALLDARIQYEELMISNVAEILSIEKNIVLYRDAMRQERDAVCQKVDTNQQLQNIVSQEIERSAYFTNYPFIETIARLDRAKGRAMTTRSIFKAMDRDFKSNPLFIEDIFKPAPFPTSDYSQCFVNFKMLQQLGRQNTFFKKLPTDIIKMIGGMSLSEEITRKEANHLFAVSHL